ncbi:MAG: hypothetical protein WCJ92_08510 [Alphaproteobacteria bacterium]
MIKKAVVFSLGIMSGFCAAAVDYGALMREHSRNPSAASTMALSKANIGIVLDVLANRESLTYSPIGSIEETMREFNVVDEDMTSKGILMETVPSDPLNDMDKNPESVVKISPLSHMVNFPYDPLPMPGYQRIGDGHVVRGTFSVENLARAASIARVVQASNPDEFNKRIPGGKFESLADVLMTYNALKAYLVHLRG